MARKANILVYDLIRSLNSKEQALIKLLIIKNKSETSPLIRLYDYICEQKHEDDTQTFHDLKDSFKSIKNYSVRKIELASLIIDFASKNIAFGPSEVDKKLVSLHRKALFLLNRGLVSYARPFIDDGLALADRYQRPLHGIQFLKIKSTLLALSNDFAAMDEWSEKVLGHYERMLQLLDVEITISAIELPLQKHLRESSLGTSQDRVSFLANLLRNPAYDDENSVEARIKRVTIGLIYEEQKQLLADGLEHTDYAAIALTYKNLLNGFSSDELEILQSHPSIYLAVLNNYARNATNVSISAGWEAIERFKGAVFEDFTTYREQQCLCYGFSLRMANAEADEKKMEKVISEYQPFFSRSEHKIKEHLRMHVYYFLCDGFLTHRRFYEARQSCRRNILLNKAAPGNRNDLAKIAYLLLLLISYEEDKPRVTTFRWIQKAENFSKQNGGFSPLEKELIAFFRKASNLKLEGEKKALLGQFVSFLHSGKDEKDAQTLYGYFRFDIWLSCKNSGTDYRAMIREINS